MTVAARIQLRPVALPGLLMAAGGFDEGDAPLIFLLAEEAWEGVTGLLEAGEVPQVWKIAALLRLDGLHGAVFAVEKNTLAIRFLLQGQPATVLPETGETLDEFIFADALERGEPRDFLIRQTHLPRPAAAGRATLAFVKNRHAQRLAEPEFS